MLSSVSRRAQGVLRRHAAVAVERRALHASAAPAAALECKLNSRTRSPASEAQVPQPSAKDVDAAVQAAHRAFHAKGPGSWSSLPPRARGALLFRLSELISQHAEELATLEALDNGKTLAQARQVDAPACASMFKY